MYRFKKSLIALIGVLTLVGIVTVTVPHIGRGASGTSNNAPTSQTQNVNVVNTPTVNAQQSGTWNVGINGTPTVGLDEANNTVKIDSTNPLPVRNVDNPANQPYQKAFPFLIQQGSNFADQAFAVPVGKRLVIEYVSGQFEISTGQLPVVTIVTFINGEQFTHFVVLNRLGVSGGILDKFVIGQPLTLYADPQSTVAIALSRNAVDGIAQGSVAVSGHFVDVP